MRTLDIPRERWESLLATLDRQLDQRPISIEVVGRALGDQAFGMHVPFRGLELDPKGSERGSLTIIAGTDDGRTIEHFIHSPTEIYLGQNVAGLIEWIAIYEGRDVITLVHFEELLELEADYGELAPPPSAG